MAASVAAVIVAGGRGLRASGPTAKQYRMLAGETVIRKALAVFASHREVDAVQPVIHRDDADLFGSAAAGLSTLPPVFGGATRQISVRCGLEALTAAPPDIVLIHDAVRPFASPDLVSRAIQAASQTGAAIPVIPVTDTVKKVSGYGRVLETLDRRGLRTAQTPQAFSFDRILAAHRRAATEDRDDFSDDAGLAEWAGIPVNTFDGEVRNMKLTTADDFVRVEAERMHVLGDIRIGNGYDIHAFGEGDHVMLGGVRIPHERGLTGHSDSDVALHALTDAILGALADGDIGHHFPPSDPQWRGASSDRFLAFACKRVAERGGVVAHLDVTLVCETPRIGPHRDAMRTRIAAIAGIPPDRVGVKASTNEGLGFIGRGEGIAAMATATVRLAWRTDDGR